MLVKSTPTNTKNAGTTHMLQEYSSYKQFNKHDRFYTLLIRQFHDSYKFIEELSEEASKISTIYLDTFVGKSKSVVIHMC